MHLYLPRDAGHLCVGHCHEDDVVNAEQRHEHQGGFQQLSAGRKQDTQAHVS